MVFLGGPRQCGKTTLAQGLLTKQDRYYNWDEDSDRQRILRKDWSDEHGLIVLDELHKFRRWKTWIKGTYDTQKRLHRFLVTGSARLDVYRRGGDSLLGRYHYWRLHPFTLSETPKGISYEDAFRRLMTVGGFPEPFLDGGEVEARRWRRERLERITKDDIRDLEGIREIQTLSLLLDLLRERVGSLIVVSNLAAELQTAPKTVKHWIEALERMYVLFTVRPFTTNLPRAVQKPFKVYFFDNADVIGDEPARFENLVATHLLKHAHLLEDRDGLRYDLCFLRDKEGHEVDFAVIRERKLESLIEVKWADSNPTRSLSYFAEKLKAPRVIQLVAKLKESVVRGKLEVRTPREFLTRLPTRTVR